MYNVCISILLLLFLYDNTDIICSTFLLRMTICEITYHDDNDNDNDM